MVTSERLRLAWVIHGFTLARRASEGADERPSLARRASVKPPLGKSHSMLHSVIMAGGSGTRFWPRSRRRLPKQFLKFGSDRTLLQETAERCRPLISAEQTWIVTGRDHAEEAGRQLNDVATSRVVIEPCGRNTAPCIGLAALMIHATDPEGVMLVMPSDHVIRPAVEFQAAVQRAVTLIEQSPNRLVLFGVPPTYPATGFGYIHRGEMLTASVALVDQPERASVRFGDATSNEPDASAFRLIDAPNNVRVIRLMPPRSPEQFTSQDNSAFHVAEFREKPDSTTAADYLASGEYFWNCGIFVWRAATILQAIEQYAPDVAARLNALRPAIGTPQWADALNAEFPRMPSISIDYAVLEKADDVCVLPATFEWDDVGSWQALTRLLPHDETENTVDGKFCGVNTNGCVVATSSEHLIATYGVHDLIIVHTPTATLVADKHDESAMRQLIAELERSGLTEYL